MQVTFVSFGPQIASSRLRAIIPQDELGKLGISKGRDILVYGKHVVPMGAVKNYGKRVFDICDDHFGDQELGRYYREHASSAHAVTCNSEVMKRRILEETGITATVIKEPYESEEGSPGIGPLLLWYGHSSNMADLERVAPTLKYPLLALSNHRYCAPWSLDSFRRAISSKCIVIIPTGKSAAKSENRMVEAVRCGRYVCAEYLPAYEQFRQFFGLGDIPDNIDSALADRERAIAKIRDAQEYVRSTYSPQAIAQNWLRVLEAVWQ